MNRRRLLIACALVFSSPLFALTCNAPFACANMNISGDITPDVPIVYHSGWNTPWGGTIAFPSFSATGNLPAPIPYNITFGTLDITPLSSILMNSTSANAAYQGYYALTDGHGNNIPYTVTYTACDSGVANNTQGITPNPAGTPVPVLPATFPFSTVQMAGPSPICHPTTGTVGAGSGQLIFTLVAPAGINTYNQGTYQDTLTISVCTSAPCT